MSDLEGLDAQLRVAMQLLGENMRSPEVMDRLVESGLDEATAAKVVYAAIEANYQSALPTPRDNAVSDLKTGLGLLVLGAVVSFLSYAFAAGRGGGRYFVAGGALLIAVFYLVRGAWRLFRR